MKLIFLKVFGEDKGEIQDLRLGLIITIYAAESKEIIQGLGAFF